MPDILSLGVAHKVAPKTTVLAEFQWFNWSRFDEVRVRLADGPDPVVRQAYNDSYAVSVGAEYAWTETWTIRAGVRYETTPTADRFRTTSVPEGNNRSLGLGATYRVRDGCELDVSLFHTVWQDGKINLTRRFFQGTAAESSVRLKATAEMRSSTLAFALRYRF